MLQFAVVMTLCLSSFHPRQIRRNGKSGENQYLFAMTVRSPVWSFVYSAAADWCFASVLPGEISDSSAAWSVCLADSPCAVQTAYNAQAGAWWRFCPSGSNGGTMSRQTGRSLPPCAIDLQWAWGKLAVLRNQAAGMLAWSCADAPLVLGTALQCLLVAGCRDLLRPQHRRMESQVLWGASPDWCILHQAENCRFIMLCLCKNFSQHTRRVILICWTVWRQA